MKDPFTLKSKDLEKTSIFQAAQLCFNVINHIIIFSTASYMSYLCYYLGNQLTSWHALFCTIGYQVLMTESIMSLYAHNFWTKHHSRQKQRTLHWVSRRLKKSSKKYIKIIKKCIWNLIWNINKTYFDFSFLER